MNTEVSALNADHEGTNNEGIQSSPFMPQARHSMDRS